MVNTVPVVTLAGVLNDPQKSEVINISGAQVQNWLQQGYRVVVLRRAFQDPADGITVNADVRFSLNVSGLRTTRENAGFEVQRLQLSFPNQTSQTVVEFEQPLQANLDVNYSGTGLLEGIWQIAEPGSAQGLPLYRTLRLEKRNLTKTQHSRLTSPALPTTKAGRYLLRFCVIDRDETTSGNADFNCSGTQVTVAYQVLDSVVVQVVPIKVQPVNKAIGPETELSWTAVPEVVVYQLQVFEKAQPDPNFIVGMLLPQQQQSTQLSELVLTKLSAGHAYDWRINALDSQGQLIGQSGLMHFVYQP